MKFHRFQTLVDRMFTLDEAETLLENHAVTTPSMLPPLVLAYVGDAYFHLFVRVRLLAFEQSNVQVMSRFGAEIVSAVWQSRAYQGIADMLTEEEQAIFRRGRNAKTHAPRSSTVAEYHRSTGFEALLGALYLDGKRARAEELAEAAFQVIAREMQKKRKGE